MLSFFPIVVERAGEGVYCGVKMFLLINYMYYHIYILFRLSFSLRRTRIFLLRTVPAGFLHEDSLSRRLEIDEIGSLGERWNPLMISCCVSQSL